MPEQPLRWGAEALWEQLTPDDNGFPQVGEAPAEVTRAGMHAFKHLAELHRGDSRWGWGGGPRSGCDRRLGGRLGEGEDVVWRLPSTVAAVAVEVPVSVAVPDDETVLDDLGCRPLKGVAEPLSLYEARPVAS